MHEFQCKLAVHFFICSDLTSGPSSFTASVSVNREEGLTWVRQPVYKVQTQRGVCKLVIDNNEDGRGEGKVRICQRPVVSICKHKYYFFNILE